MITLDQCKAKRVPVESAVTQLLGFARRFQEKFALVTLLRTSGN
jgi:hypothetical protein